MEKEDNPVNNSDTDVSLSKYIDNLLKEEQEIDNKENEKIIKCLISKIIEKSEF